MSVSGTPHKPKPPHRSVELGFKSAIASDAEGRTLLISLRRGVEANVRAISTDCCNQLESHSLNVGQKTCFGSFPCIGSRSTEAELC